MIFFAATGIGFAVARWCSANRERTGWRGWLATWWPNASLVIGLVLAVLIVVTA